MLMSEYQKLASNKANLNLSRYESLICSALGLCGEAGEFADRIKKIFFHKHPMSTEERQFLKDELGDVLWYVAFACCVLEIELDDLAAENLKKLDNRYPETFTPEQSLNRLQNGSELATVP